MRCKKKGFFIVLLLQICTSLIGQEESKHNFQVAFKGGYGFIIAHNPTMQYFADQHIQKYELNVEKHTFGTKLWQQRFGFPKIGFSISYFDLNNEQHLGNAFAFAPHYNFRFLGRKAFQLRLKTAIGLGYVAKPFNAENNFKNAAIGSHFNLFFSLLLESEWKISARTSLLLGANFSHFSNASFKTPNLGINIPTAELGIAYHLGAKRANQEETKESFKAPERGSWSLNTGIGFNEIYPPNGNKYLAKNVSIMNERKLNHKSSFGVAMDFFYNPAQRKALANDSIFIDKGWENLQFGFSAYYMIHLGKFSAYIQNGYYFKSKDEELGNLYQIVGGRIFLTERINGLVAIKTHFAKAEYLLLGLHLKLSKQHE